MMEKDNMQFLTREEHKKLTRKEFREKYWNGYNENLFLIFITLDIEDGSDEKEQILINDINTLREMCSKNNKRISELDIKEDLMIKNFKGMNLVLLMLSIALLILGSLFIIAI